MRNGIFHSRASVSVIISVIYAVLTTVSATEYVYRTEAFDKNIKTIQVRNLSKTPYYPIIELDGYDKISLSFDDLSSEQNTYTYAIVHCDADWTRSDLTESQYINGYTGGYLEHESSMNTYFPYHHFSMEFPNEEASCTVSGNYAILVYKDNNVDEPVLSACFSVVESLVSVNCSISPSTDIDYKKGHQQVSVTVDYSDYQISQPENTVKVIVQQNRRRDNQAVLDKPSFFQRNSFNYKLNPALIFDAGNQYYSFDISSTRILSSLVESIDYYKPYYHATLYPNRPRSKNTTYSFSEDIAGRYIINVQDSYDPDTDGDYFFTHFRLYMDVPYLDGEVHILGDLTDNTIGKNSRMTYDFEKSCYEKTLLLKQGGYNFIYAYVPLTDNGKGYTGAIEGNFWETQNEYAVYVYHRPFGSLYDKLVGYDIIFSNSNRH